MTSCHCSTFERQMSPNEPAACHRRAWPEPRGSDIVVASRLVPDEDLRARSPAQAPGQACRPRYPWSRPGPSARSGGSSGKDSSQRPAPATAGRPKAAAPNRKPIPATPCPASNSSPILRPYHKARRVKQAFKYHPATCQGTARRRPARRCGPQFRPSMRLRTRQITATIFQSTSNETAGSSDQLIFGLI